MVRYIAELFREVGPEHHIEAVKWILEFDKVEPGRFGMVKIGGEIVQDTEMLDTLCDKVAKLSRLDFITPIVYGWGKALTHRLSEAGIVCEQCDNERVTLPEAMTHVEDISAEYGYQIVNELKKRGIKADYVDKVFESFPKQYESISYEHRTGDIIGVNIDTINAMIADGTVPVISPLGYDHAGNSLNNNADSAGNALMSKIKPRKCIMAMKVGGIYNKEEHIIPRIYCDDDFEALISRGTVSGGAAKKLGEIKSLLDKLHKTEADYKPSVQVIHPRNLVVELFTDKGMGTYITKN